LAGSALLDLGQQLAATLVQTQELVQGLGRSAARERGPGRLGILADAPKVEQLASGRSRLGGAGPGARLRGLSGL